MSKNRVGAGSTPWYVDAMPDVIAAPSARRRPERAPAAPTSPAAAAAHAAPAAHRRGARDPAGDYERIARAIEYLRARAADQPSLAAVARAVHLSPFHLQRLFSRWAGLSPKRFLQTLTLEEAKRRLRDHADVLTATYDSGLSSPGRLHDLFVAVEAVTPGEFKAFGRGLRIGYGVHPTPFGWCLLARTARGICSLGFLGGRDAGEVAIRELRQDWPEAECVPEDEGTGRLVRQLFGRPRPAAAPLPLVVRGTNFQIQVWRALLRLPPGARVSYRQVAVGIGRPDAVRAVASAVGANPIAVVIPCHRVLRSDGSPGGYRWGLTRKAAINAWEEAARS
jgi:AraC family transcriptional regulator of adaptative response/methylated-DNA-[protein]-cysteine methyltransferase